MIDVTGIDKGALVAGLFNASQPQGMGFLHLGALAPMTVDEGQKIFDDQKANGVGEVYFDYLNGRVMKVEVSGDELDPRLFDRDNGAGAAARAIESLRQQ